MVKKMKYRKTIPYTDNVRKVLLSGALKVNRGQWFMHPVWGKCTLDRIEQGETILCQPYYRVKYVAHGYYRGVK